MVRFVWVGNGIGWAGVLGMHGRVDISSDGKWSLVGYQVQKVVVI
jgi:hypothetical protein